VGLRSCELVPPYNYFEDCAADWKWSSAAAFEGVSSPIPLDPIPWDWLAEA